MADNYLDSLNRIPPSGCGLGAHPFLLSIANFGIRAGMSPLQIHEDIRKAIPQGQRRIPDREIGDAINKALSDHAGGCFIPRERSKPLVRDGNAALRRIIDQGRTFSEADLWDLSPVRLWERPKEDPALILESLYLPTDIIFIGELHDTDTIRSAGAWITHIRNGGKIAPHIIANPLTGDPAPTKTGDKTTKRGDGNIKEYRFAIAEFDGLPKPDQIRFWAAVKLPLVCLIDSGGKSIHAWIDVQKLAQVEKPDKWQAEIKERLYDRILTPLGVDPACSNPARLSRLPGHYRTEKKAMQKLLWLSPEGRAVL